MPESCRSCGLCSAPAASRTSRRARTVVVCPPLPVLDTGRPGSIDDDARRLGVHLDGEIRPRARGLEVSGRRRGAPPLAGVELVIADAFLAVAIEVALRGMPSSPAPSMIASISSCFFRCPSRERARRAVELAFTALVALEPPEVRQHVGPRPAGIALGRPLIVVLRLAADVDEAVDRRAAAQSLAPRPIHACVHSSSARARCRSPSCRPGGTSSCHSRSARGSRGNRPRDPLPAAEPCCGRRKSIGSRARSRPCQRRRSRSRMRKSGRAWRSGRGIDRGRRARFVAFRSRAPRTAECTARRGPQARLQPPERRHASTVSADTKP